MINLHEIVRILFNKHGSPVKSIPRFSINRESNIPVFYPEHARLHYTIYLDHVTPESDSSQLSTCASRTGKYFWRYNVFTFYLRLVVVPVLHPGQQVSVFPRVAFIPGITLISL